MTTDSTPTLAEQLEYEMKLQTTAVKLTADYLAGQIPFVLLAQGQDWVRPKTPDWQLRVQRVEPRTGTVHLCLMGPWQYRHLMVKWSDQETLSYVNFFRGSGTATFDNATQLREWLDDAQAAR